MPTIASRLDQHKGITSGFDYLRLFLAIGILCFHSVTEVTTGDGRAPWFSEWRFIGATLLPMFFALSGFLVTASLLRTARLSTFFAYRAVRIVPALAVEVALSALLIGPLLTSVPLGSYFTSPLFYSYFANIIGDVHYVLPGVFGNNPNPHIINRSLWTIPYELYCYLALGLLAVTGFVSRRTLFLLAVTGFIVFRIAYSNFYQPEKDYGPIGGVLVVSFLCGCLLHLYREKISLSKPACVVALAGSFILLSLPNFSYLACPLVAYATVYLGLLNPPKRSFLLRGDYSYGIYLFAYPIQQAAILLLPGVATGWINAAIALPFCILYAFFSWHCIEQPCLKRKKDIAAPIEQLADKLKKLITS